MCTHQTLIRNPYTGIRMLVNCGKCEACLQEKADKRASRIRNHVNQFGVPVYDCLFVTLTYSNLFIPYILKGELQNMLDNPEEPIHVFRDNDRRFVLGRAVRDGNGNILRDVSGQYHRIMHRKLERGLKVLDTLFITDLQYHGIPLSLSELDRHSLPSNYPRQWLSYDKWKYTDKHRLPVAWYPDFQNYIKRVTKTFRKHDINFTWFCCSEYGETTGRPHFHMLAFVPRGNYEFAKSVFCSHWQYDNNNRRKCEAPRKDLASYVASYVNCRSSLPYLFQNAWCFSPHHVYSSGFGFGNEYLSLHKILEYADRGDFSYPCQTVVNGTLTTIDIPIPKYAVSRYFPKFKGYCWLTADEIYAIAFRPQRYKFFSAVLARQGKIYYDADVVHKTVVMLANKQKLWLVESGLSLHEFAERYSTVYTSYSSYFLKKSLSSLVTPLDLTSYYVDSLCHHDYLSVYGVDRSNIPRDWLYGSTNPAIMARSRELSMKFRRKSKDRKRNNAIDSYYINV